ALRWALFRGSVTVWVGGFDSYEKGETYARERRSGGGGLGGHDRGRAADPVLPGVRRGNAGGQQSLAGQAHHLALAGLGRGGPVRTSATAGARAGPRRRPALVAPSAETDHSGFGPKE